MPAASDILKAADPLRVCLYGPAKSRKTWWAYAAAEAGYRVLCFDSDRGNSILTQISPAARERIYILQCHDGVADAFASTFATFAFKTFEFYINEATRRVSFTPQAGLSHIDMRGFGSDTIVVLDSYTALVQSVTKQFCIENNIDLADAKKLEWPGYAFAGLWLNWLLAQIKLLPCHLVLIGHVTQYEKYKKGPDGKLTPVPEWSRRQLKSASNPHSMNITKDFTDVLYAYVEGRTTYIDTRGNQHEEAGSRHVPPARYTWDDLSFAKLAEAAGHKAPQPPAQPFLFPEVMQAERRSAPAQRAVLGSAAPAPVLNPAVGTASAIGGITIPPRPSILKS